jgi:hypothetical protein
VEADDGRKGVAKPSHSGPSGKQRNEEKKKNRQYM